MDVWRDYISHEIDVSKELDPNFDFPKIHLMSHWVEQICRYEVLQQLSANAMELCIHHGIKVQVEGLEAEPICQMCPCTGSQSWRRGDRWNDWVWVKQCPGRCYGKQNGRLPWQLQRPF